MRSAASAQSRKAEAGASLVELMVAIVVLATGVLGLASTAAVVTRQVAVGRAMGTAATIARSRFEQQRSLNCAGLTSGSAVIRGYSESWTVTAVTRAVKVTEVVTFTTARGPKTQTYVTMFPCPGNP